MECVMHPKLLYAHFHEMIGMQRAALEAKIRTFSSSHIVHKVMAGPGCRGCQNGGVVARHQASSSSRRLPDMP